MLGWKKHAGAWPHFLLKRGGGGTDQGYSAGGKGGRLLAADVVAKAAASLNLQRIAKGGAAIHRLRDLHRASHSPWLGQGDVPWWLVCTTRGNPGKNADDHRTNQPQSAFPIEPSHSERCDIFANV